MTDKMMRIAGRGEDGYPRAIKTDVEGNVSVMRNAQFHFASIDGTAIEQGQSEEVLIKPSRGNVGRLQNLSIRADGSTEIELRLRLNFNNGENELFLIKNNGNVILRNNTIYREYGYFDITSLVQTNEELFKHLNNLVFSNEYPLYLRIRNLGASENITRTSARFSYEVIG